MTINYTWTITNLQCAPSENGLTNVIKTIHWRYTGQEEEENGLSAVINGLIGVESPDPDNFMEYSSITEDIIISWLENILNVSGDSLSLQQSIINEIETKHNPPIISLELPWIE